MSNETTGLEEQLKIANDLLKVKFEGNFIGWDILPITSLATCRNSRYFVSGSRQSKIDVWDLQDKKLCYRLEDPDHRETLTSVVITADSKYIIAGSQENTVSIWDTEERKLLTRFIAHNDRVSGIALAPDNKSFVSVSRDKSIAIWDLREKTLVKRIENAHTKEISSVVISSGDSKIITGSYDQSIGIWDLKSGDHQDRLSDEKMDKITALAVSPDNQYLVSASFNKSIELWNLKEKKLVHIFEKAHSSLISALTVGPDSQYIVSGSWDKTMAVWSIAAKKMSDRIQNIHEAEITALCITPDKKYLMSSSWTTIYIWGMDEKKLIHSFQNAHRDSVSVVAVSDDCKTLISGSEDKSIKVWDLQKRELKNKPLTMHSGAITALLLSSNNYLISASTDKTIGIFDLNHWKILNKISYESKVTSIAVASDAQIFATGAANRIRLWNLENGSQIKDLEKPHEGEVRSLVITANSKYIISGSADKTIGLWDFKDEKKTLIYRFEDNHEIKVITATKDCKYIVSASEGRTMCIWGIEEKKLLQRFNLDTVIVSIATTDSRYVITGSAEKRRISLWDISERRFLTEITGKPHSEGIASVAVSSDGRYIVSGSKDRTIGIWDFKDKDSFYQLEEEDKRKITSMAVSADNKFLAYCSRDKNVSLWDFEEKKLFHFSGDRDHKDWISCLAISEDSKLMVSGSWDQAICVWDLQERSLIDKIEGAHDDMITSIAITKKSDLVVSSSKDMTIRIWNLQERKQTHVFEAAHSDNITAVALSSDDQWIISSSWDKTLAFWSIRDKNMLFRFENAHKDWVTSVAFTADSNRIVSASNDKTIAVWTVQEKRLLYRFDAAHGDAITSIAVTADSRYILSGSKDKSIALWDIDEKKVLAQFEEGDGTGVTAVAIASGRRCLISAQKSAAIRYIGERLYSSKSTFIPLQLLASQVYSEASGSILAGPGPKHAYIPQSRDLAVIAKTHFMSTRWNLLNFLVFLLPNVNPVEYLDFVIRNRIYLSIDLFKKSQLDYMLHYKGSRTIAVDEFFAYFFRKMPSLINLTAPSKVKVMANLSKTTYKVFKLQTTQSFLNYLTSFHLRDPKLYIQNPEILPSSGRILRKMEKGFILCESLNISEMDINSVVNRKGKSSLTYSVIAFASTYQIGSPESANLLKVFDEIDINNVTFYEAAVVQNLINLFWERAKKLLWSEVIFYGLATGLYTAFACTRTIRDDVAPQVLIPATCLMLVPLSFELLQMASNVKSYVSDPWNYIDLLLIIIEVLSAILVWTGVQPDAQSFFISCSIILFYTKLLLVLRVVEQLRSLIRMIMEVLKDMVSFMVVIIVYIFAFSIVFFQSRRAYDDDSVDQGNFGNDLMEMYYLIYTGGDSSNYYGVTTPFFILVTFLQALVLLNLIISIMGDTYARVKSSANVIDSREKVNMLVELYDVATQLKRFRFCNRRRGLVHAQEGHTEGSDMIKKFLLVVEPYKIEIDLKEKVESKPEEQVALAQQTNSSEMNEMILSKLYYIEGKMNEMLRNEEKEAEANQLKEITEKVEAIESSMKLMQSTISSLEGKISSSVEAKIAAKLEEKFPKVTEGKKPPENDLSIPIQEVNTTNSLHYYN